MLMKNFGDLFILALPYLILGGLLVGITLRSLIYFTVKRHEWFIREFEKRVNLYLDTIVAKSEGQGSFYGQTKKLIEKTYYEAFELRDRLKRRSYDRILSTNDRIFMVRQACAWLIKDSLKQLRLIKWSSDTPKMVAIIKSTFHHNPYFNRIAGIFPITTTNDLVGIFPSLFVVAGILGTFIGIAKGLPELGAMSIDDADNSKLIMDRFLNEVSFAMQASILGIFSSIVMNIVNTWLSPEKLYVSMIDRFENSLENIWNLSANNQSEESDVDEEITKDAIELLAEESVTVEILSHPRGREYDAPKKEKVS